MIFNVDEFTGLWIQLTQGRNLSLLLVAAAVALTAALDVLLRFGRARTTRRLRIAAAAYAEREIANEPHKRRDRAPRLSASGASA